LYKAKDRIRILNIGIMSEGALLGCHDTYNNDPVERLYAKCDYTKCHFALCLMLSVFVLSIMLLSVIMLRIKSVNDIMLSIRTLSFIRQCC
jgi:hypothetical protein